MVRRHETFNEDNNLFVDVEDHLRVIQEECWQIAHDHGWHDEPRSWGDRIALMHSELSEALEEVRDGKFEMYFSEEKPDKPEGVVVELADTIIRIFDACQENGLNLVEALQAKLQYNRTRPYRHGGRAL